MVAYSCLFCFFSSRRWHTRLQGDWSSDVCSSDLGSLAPAPDFPANRGSFAADPWACLPTRPRDSCHTFFPCASWSSCGCTQDTIYITSSTQCNTNVDTHSSLFCSSLQLLLKTKHFPSSKRQKREKAVEVGLAQASLSHLPEKDVMGSQPARRSR